MSRKSFKPQNVEVTATYVNGKPAVMLSFETKDGPKCLHRVFRSRDERDAALPVFDEAVFRIMNGQLPDLNQIQEVLQ